MSGSRLRIPGTMLLKLARTLFSETLFSTVVQPTISDLQREVAAAGSDRRARLRAQRRGYAAFWTVALFAPFVSRGARDADTMPNTFAPFVVSGIIVGLLGAFGPLLGTLIGIASALVAILMHTWYERHPSDIPTPDEPLQRRSPQINFSSTEVAGNAGGLIFAIGTVFIVAVGLPSVLWFLAAGTVAGVSLAWALSAWHSSHPEQGRPEYRIVSR